MEINTDKTFIGLDVGSRRIGVARIHSIPKIAEPLEHIDTVDNAVIDSIVKTVAEYQADAVVVGLPRGLDGQETEQTKYCIDFAKNLKIKLAVPVYMIDEAGTSKLAEDMLKGNNPTSSDSMAAAILLEDFISVVDKESLRV